MTLRRRGRISCFNNMKMSKSTETSCASAAFLSGRGSSEWPNSQKVVDALDAQKQDTSDVYTILICHCPEVFYTSLQNVRVDLGISGHAHGRTCTPAAHGWALVHQSGLFAQVYQRRSPNRGIHRRHQQGIGRFRAISADI